MKLFKRNKGADGQVNPAEPAPAEELAPAEGQPGGEAQAQQAPEAETAEIVEQQGSAADAAAAGGEEPAGKETSGVEASGGFFSRLREINTDSSFSLIAEAVARSLPSGFSTTIRVVLVISPASDICSAVSPNNEGIVAR